MTRPAPQLIAFYLPQFHPISENDAWWGPGFTEWHNVARARPLFRGHVQPRLPGELGFYDLRLDRTRLDQAALARRHGVHAFCYWHYWFGGKRLLELPFESVLQSGEPDLPFCLGWANESWTGVWHGAPGKVLMEQTYPPGDADRHYEVLRRAFHDPRYLRHEGRPLLYVYKPREVPPEARYLERLRALARADGLPGLHVVGTWSPNPGGRFQSAEAVGLDAAVITNVSGRHSESPVHWLAAVARKLAGRRGLPLGPKRLRYADAVGPMLPPLETFPFPAYHCVISNWDNTPRSGRRGLVLTGGSPELFGAALRMALDSLASRTPRAGAGPFVFLKSWNEWAEGNYLEPDELHGRGWLEAIAAALDATSAHPRSPSRAASDGG